MTLLARESNKDGRLYVYFQIVNEERKVKLKFPAASRAVSFTAVALIFGLMAFPLLGQAKSAATDDFKKFEKSTLVTPADFIQHAASEEVDIHDLYFELRAY